MIKLEHFDMQGVDNAILAWWVSRRDETVDELLQELTTMKTEDRDNWLYEILHMSLPIREFVPIFYILSRCPRSFVDQQDRYRVGFAYWEQSLRVKDLSRFASTSEYYTPPQLSLVDDKHLSNSPMNKLCRDLVDEHNSLADKLSKNPEDGSDLYAVTMHVLERVYDQLVNAGLARHHARGVIPLHVEVRMSVQCNLQSVLHMLRSRTCYFAQGDYWRPVVKGIVDNLNAVLPTKLVRSLLTLPCTGKGDCPVRRDIMDRIDDKSNPVCPILIKNFLGINESEEVYDLMVERYGESYIREFKSYTTQWSV